MARRGTKPAILMRNSTTEDTRIEIVLEQYYRKLEVRNMSKETIRLYKVHLHDFYNRCEATDITEITADTVDSYILAKRKDGQANDRTVNSYLRSIRAFLYFCMNDKHYIPPFKIVLPKVDKEVKETYTDTELSRLLKKPDLKTSSFNEYKIWVLESYLLSTGNRISSALNIKIEHLDFDSMLIKLEKTKSRKQQLIPMGRKLASILQEYLKYRKGEPTDYLFCNTCGDKAYLRTIQEQISTFNKSRGVEKTSAHMFRRTFAKQWIINGGGAFELQKLMGHSDLTVTREYVELFSNDIQQNYNLFNPLDNLFGDTEKKPVIRMNTGRRK